MTPGRCCAVAIGGSAGALDALSQILPALPAHFAAPILVVVHLPADRPSVLAEVLQRKCTLRIGEAEDKEPLQPGHVYIAPPDYHLLIESDARISFCSDEPRMFSRPSIDVLFESAAEAFGSGLIGLVLSGANSDGALGLRTVAAAGGLALVQRPADAQCPAMPEAALQACPAARAVPTAEIACLLQERVHDRT